MRHYEILANKCIPYFPNIELAPEKTMALLPKKLIIKGNRLFERLQHKKNISELTTEEMAECESLSTELLNYTKEHLTTYKMAQYVLNKSNSNDVQSILYLSGDTNPDYMRCLTLHGFKKILGKNCHDYPIIPHIYKQTNVDYSNFHGKGMTYSGLLDLDLHDAESDKNVEQDILNKKYDLIIYGSLHRGMPFYDLVCDTYESDKIILLCGEDIRVYGPGAPPYGKNIHKCEHTKLAMKGHYVFVREL